MHNDIYSISHSKMWVTHHNSRESKGCKLRPTNWTTACPGSEICHLPFEGRFDIFLGERKRNAKLVKGAIVRFEVFVSVFEAIV
jgi:hypothetical protein